jgi:hypothetical protein
MLFEFGQEIVAHRVPADRADETYMVPSRAEPACHVGRAPSDAPSQRLGIDVVAGAGMRRTRRTMSAATTPNTTTSAMYKT